MPRSPFSYAVYRVVPSIERGERLNVGVIVFCRPLDFLGARTHLDARRLHALFPGCEPDPLRPQLAAIERVAAGAPDGGPIAQLDTTARFHWLTAPSSTVIQPSRVHTGMTDDPQGELDALFASLVG